MPQTFCTKCGYDLYSLGLDSEGMAKCPECGVRGMPSPWNHYRGQWAFPILAVVAQAPMALACLGLFGGWNQRSVEDNEVLFFLASALIVPLSAVASVLLAAIPGLVLRSILRSPWAQYRTAVLLGASMSIFLAVAMILVFGFLAF